MNHHIKDKQAGVTLIEFLMVMAVLGIVIGAIYNIFVSRGTRTTWKTSGSRWNKMPGLPPT